MADSLSPAAQKEMARLQAFGRSLARNPDGRRSRTRLTPPPRVTARAREFVREGEGWDGQQAPGSYRGAYRRTGRPGRPVVSWGIGAAAEAARQAAETAARDPLE